MKRNKIVKKDRRMTVNDLFQELSKIDENDRDKPVLIETPEGGFHLHIADIADYPGFRAFFIFCAK